MKSSQRTKILWQRGLCKFQVLGSAVTFPSFHTAARWGEKKFTLI